MTDGPVICSRICTSYSIHIIILIFISYGQRDRPVVSLKGGSGFEPPTALCVHLSPSLSRMPSSLPAVQGYLIYFNNNVYVALDKCVAKKNNLQSHTHNFLYLLINPMGFGNISISIYRFHDMRQVIVLVFGYSNLVKWHVGCLFLVLIYRCSIICLDPLSQYSHITDDYISKSSLQCHITIKRSRYFVQEYRLIDGLVLSTSPGPKILL